MTGDRSSDDSSSAAVPPPPDPFEPEVFILPAGSPLYRVFSNNRTVTDFNPSGPPAVHRFSFFGDPPVPVLYAASTDVAAACESLLHDVSVRGGYIKPASYRNKAMGLARPRRDLRLVSFTGTGLRKLKVTQGELTDTLSSQYPMTNRWAESAHTAGFDGIVWMARKCNDAHAYVLFGDRLGNDLAQDDGFGRVFAGGDGFDWLVDFCTPLDVEVLTDL